MRVIKRGPLLEFARRHPDAYMALDDWYRVARHARWRNLRDVRRAFPTADAVRVASGRTATVINIRGNHYRLVLAIHYNTQVVFVLRVLTHAEYDRDTWKAQL